jgi:carboxyl-terminal processing protease
MIPKKTKSAFLLLLIFLSGIVLWVAVAQSYDIYEEISKNLRIFGNIYKEISKRYVDEVDPKNFLKAGINGMLNTLDPYTNYIEKEDKDQLQILTDGKYEGIGLLLHLRNGAVTVGDPPFLGTPSARAGIREGDKIVKVDGVSTKILGLDESSQRIRGKAGTEVTLTIERDGVSEPLEFKLIREQIQVEDVQYTGFVNKNIGYIRLTRFSKNAGAEVESAITHLNQHKLEGLILDLRSNPGGMLEAAVEVSDLFLDKDLMIVSTRGRTSNSNQEFKSLRDPIYGKEPLIILVNNISASASEIVAGAIQDHDRGLVLGDTTFGKGLVQTVVPLSRDEALKITTAKYYTPSGRCIQRANYSTWTDTSQTETSTEFKTVGGRSVYGGGGIAPDVRIEPRETNDLVWDLRRKSLFFNFAVHYANTHTVSDSVINVDQKMLDDFKKYLEEEKYQYEHPIENDLGELKQEVLKKGYSPSILLDIQKLQNALGALKEEIFLTSSEDIKRSLKLELTSKSFGTQKEIELSIQDDPVIQKAVEIFHDKANYRGYLVKSD